MRPLRTVVARCPLCGREPTVEHARGKDFEYGSTGDTEWTLRRCATCDVISLSPRPDEVELPVIYPSNYYAYDFAATRSVGYRIKDWLDRQAAKAYLRAAPPGGNVLDVGCGDGRLLRILRARGVPRERLFGVELDEHAVAAARADGFQVVQGRFEEADLPAGTFGLIVLQQVIEHVPDPRNMIRRLRELLVPGGALVIETPNTRSWDHRLFSRRHWGGYHIPRHFHLFDDRSLPALLRNTGLRVTRVDALASPNFWIQSLHHRSAESGLPKAWVRLFQPHPPRFLPLAVFSALDGLGKLARVTSNMRVVAIREGNPPC
ncbi:MAG: class I SAM-dependent methyltransferase [Thermoanaerobaculia bacterium]